MIVFFFIKTVFGVYRNRTDCDAYFEDVVFSEPVSFRDAVFRFNYPMLGGVDLPALVLVTAKPDNWPDDAVQWLRGGERLKTSSIQNKEDAKDSCASLRHCVAKQGLPEDEHFFFRREMGYVSQIGKWWEWLPYRAFGLVSNFGYSIWRPLIGLVGLWTFGTLIYLIAFAARDIDAGLHRVDLNAAALSFANMFKFLGFQRAYFDVAELREMSAGLQVWGGLQTILGFILLFFLGLGLRTRFRMR